VGAKHCQPSESHDESQEDSYGPQSMEGAANPVSALEMAMTAATAFRRSDGARRYGPEVGKPAVRMASAAHRETPDACL
jgi:hypothetical protein